MLSLECSEPRAAAAAAAKPQLPTTSKAAQTSAAAGCSKEKRMPPCFYPRRFVLAKLTFAFSYLKIRFTVFCLQIDVQ